MFKNGFKLAEEVDSEIVLRRYRELSRFEDNHEQRANDISKKKKKKKIFKKALIKLFIY